MPSARGESAGQYWRDLLNRGSLPPAERPAFAEFALAKVSRTFALNIRVLPQPLRQQVLYAYLYCRMADTLEDDPHLPPAEKARLLRLFADLFVLEEKDPPTAAQAAGALAEQIPAAWKASRDWEHLLLAHAPELLLPFLDFPAPVRKVISRCVGEMCAGMAGFAEKSGNADRNLVETLEELDNYCYYVAGTVGVLLCDLFVRHSGHIRVERAKSLKALCVSFGLGLQLTNILKDLHEDRKRNVSFVPGQLLAEEKLTFQDFLRPERRAAAKRVYRVLLGKAKQHLEDALEYSCLIPRWDRRLRLFCLWPLFMAAETLALLGESTEALTGGVRLKISRQKVKDIVRRTRIFCWSNRWIRMEFRKPIRRLETALQSLSVS
jgi:farnesyl-diphosphate farnesyltransferase